MEKVVSFGKLVVCFAKPCAQWLWTVLITSIALVLFVFLFVGHGLLQKSLRGQEIS